MRFVGKLTTFRCGMALVVGLTAAQADLSAQVYRYSERSSESLGVRGAAIDLRGSYQRSIFGSPFANQPFSISGMVGAQNAFRGIGAGVTAPPIGGGQIGCGPGSLGGLGLVAPGWWGLGPGPGVGYWGSGYGLYPSAWWVGGWNGGWAPNNGWGPGWGGFGWNTPLWGVGPMPFWDNGFVWDWGFLGGVNDVVQQGNARFGGIRPVNRQRAQAGALPAPGMIGGGNGGRGLNAVNPVAVQAPRVANAVRQKRTSPPSERQRPEAENRPEPSLEDRLQTADRLARNGLLGEALERYRKTADSVPDQPGPWFRLAQAYSLADKPAEAVAALKEAERRETESNRDYSKRLKWDEIGDSVALDRIRNRFEEWSKDAEMSDLNRLKATLTAADRPLVVATP